VCLSASSVVFLVVFTAWRYSCRTYFPPDILSPSFPQHSRVREVATYARRTGRTVTIAAGFPIHFLFAYSLLLEDTIWGAPFLILSRETLSHITPSGVLCRNITLHPTSVQYNFTLSDRSVYCNTFSVPLPTIQACF
jgi:hypothetical protein